MMSLASLQASQVDALRHNFSTSETENEHFRRCWAQQSCDGCLDSDECSWCPFTWSCVPNSQPIQFLAPAYEDQICPHPAEQWELRTTPFGCRVSSTTTVAVATSILATMVLSAILVVVVVVLVRLNRQGKLRSFWGKTLGKVWGTHRSVTESQEESQERDPLLPG